MRPSRAVRLSRRRNPFFRAPAGRVGLPQLNERTLNNDIIHGWGLGGRRLALIAPEFDAERGPPVSKR
jgi:hypothetical protein